MLTPLGLELTAEERALYSEHKPYGFCLFGKHCDNPTQMRELTTSLRDVAGDDVVIAIDQEGGRVARMRGPHWKEFPAAAKMDDVYTTYRAIGEMLADVGVTMDFAPCLDVIPEGGRCDAIGDRCFSSDPLECGRKGYDACRGLLDAGIFPVIKHMPGHGRAVEDSHHFLPTVEADENALMDDLRSFQYVVSSDVADQIGGMTAHIIFNVWDKETPSTLSNIMINKIIRKEIGFTGLLFSDDLVMKALDRYGAMVDRVHLSLKAGCDIALPCHTSIEDSRKILESFA